MNIELSSLIVTGLSIVAAILAWSVKLIWSKQYMDAKDEIIKSKDAQIDMLNKEIELIKELSSSKTREFFLRVKTSLEEQINFLEKENHELRQIIDMMNKKVTEELNIDQSANSPNESNLDNIKQQLHQITAKYMDQVGKKLSDNSRSIEEVKNLLTKVNKETSDIQDVLELEVRNIKSKN